MEHETKKALCDECAQIGVETVSAYTLGDGLNLCVDCWQEVKDDCEKAEG